MMLRVDFVFLLLVASLAHGLDNGLGRTPQMGWNSWNHYHCDIDQDLIKKTADLLVSTGLKDAGYTYLNMDDCWMNPQRVNGRQIGDLKRFPDGIKSLADYTHSLGLRFGLYSDSGNKTCAGFPASLGYEIVDAQTWASWGVDYVKVDDCYTNDTPAVHRYSVMRDALNATGRSIFFSICDGGDFVAPWGAAVGNSWRTTDDIFDTFERMITRADQNEPLYPHAEPGAWNDPDMLEVGNGGMTFDEYKTHFSLWCLMKAPLLIGCDLSNMTNETLTILLNKEAIAVNQDPLGIQGHRVWSDGASLAEQNVGVPPGQREVWAGQLENGSVAVVLFNRGTNATEITAKWEDIGLPSASRVFVRDIWAHANLRVAEKEITLPVAPHGVVFLRLTPLKFL